MKKQVYKNAKILAEDHRRIKEWAAQREMKVYEVISYLVNKQ